jgi:hypothetical protein
MAWDCHATRIQPGPGPGAGGEANAGASVTGYNEGLALRLPSTPAGDEKQPGVRPDLASLPGVYWKGGHAPFGLRKLEAVEKRFL